MNSNKKDLWIEAYNLSTAKMPLPKYWKNKIIFDDKIGTYKITLNEKSVPVFFSSMLTGQRALDKGSFERLKWHVKNVIK